MTFGLEHRPFADFDDEVRIADISALHDLVTSPVAERCLHAWAGDSPSRAALLSEVAFVLIRWSKALGQPRTPTLAAAFTVTHDYWAEEYYDAGGGHLVDRSKWYPAPNGPVVFPGADNDDEYVVPVLLYPVFFWVNRLRVGLASPRLGRPAHRYHAGYKVVTPSEQTFQYLRQIGPPVVLTDVRVEKVPYRLIE
jgi:hypothetical protein